VIAGRGAQIVVEFSVDYAWVNGAWLCRALRRSARAGVPKQLGRALRVEPRQGPERAATLAQLSWL